LALAWPIALLRVLRRFCSSWRADLQALAFGLQLLE
jgi:hypothetical protein